jgi:hypothetical protein
LLLRLFVVVVVVVVAGRGAAGLNIVSVCLLAFERYWPAAGQRRRRRKSKHDVFVRNSARSNIRIVR